jgi:hypothetical protein
MEEIMKIKLKHFRLFFAITFMAFFFIFSPVQAIPEGCTESDYIDDYFCSMDYNFTSYQPDGTIFTNGMIPLGYGNYGYHPVINLGGNLYFNSNRSWARINYTVAIPWDMNYVFNIYNGMGYYGGAYTWELIVDNEVWCDVPGNCYGELTTGYHTISLVAYSHWAGCIYDCYWTAPFYVDISSVETTPFIGYWTNSLTNNDDFDLIYINNETVTFDVNVYNTPIYNYSWFVDGNKQESFTSNLSLIFSDSAYHLIEVYAQNNAGISGERIWSLYPSAEPTPTPIPTPTPVLSNQAKYTTDSDVEIYFWDILFLAFGLYIGTFFITLGDKR